MRKMIMIEKTCVYFTKKIRIAMVNSRKEISFTFLSEERKNRPGR